MGIKGIFGFFKNMSTIKTTVDPTPRILGQLHLLHQLHTNNGHMASAPMREIHEFHERQEEQRIRNNGGHMCQFRPKAQFEPDSHNRITCYSCGNASNISRQSCDTKYCNRCWKLHCQANDWDCEISECANKKSTKKKLSLQQRGEINPNNIQNILDLSGDPKYRHLSEKRKKMFTTRKRKMMIPEKKIENELSDTEEVDDVTSETDEEQERTFILDNDNNVFGPRCEYPPLVVIKSEPQTLPKLVSPKKKPKTEPTSSPKRRSDDGEKWITVKKRKPFY